MGLLHSGQRKAYLCLDKLQKILCPDYKAAAAHWAVCKALGALSKLCALLEWCLPPAFIGNLEPEIPQVMILRCLTCQGREEATCCWERKLGEMEAREDSHHPHRSPVPWIRQAEWVPQVLLPPSVHHPWGCPNLQQLAGPPLSAAWGYQQPGHWREWGPTHTASQAPWFASHRSWLVVGSTGSKLRHQAFVCTAVPGQLHAAACVCTHTVHPAVVP